MSVEHAKRNQQGLYGAIVNSGAWWGLLLATIVFSVVSALPDGSFEAWGWRIPFLVGGLLLVIALYIRVSVQESPEFDKVRQQDVQRKAPIVEVLKVHPRRTVLLVLSYLAAGAVFYTINVFALTYGTSIGVSRSKMLLLITVTTVFTLAVVPLFGWLSDRVGRKAIYVASIPAMGIGVYVWFALLGTGNTVLMLLGFLVISVPISAYYGTMATFFSRIFPAEVRFTGLAVGYTVGAVLGSAAAPLVSTYLLGRTGGWLAIAVYLSALTVVSFVASLFLDEQPEGSRTQSTQPAPAVNATQ